MVEEDDLSTHVADPVRLAALHAVALLDTATEDSFDRLSELAAQIVNAPVALVTLVDSNRQFFKSCLGLPEPWQSRRETPLSHSFCQHNRIAGRPLLIEDARTHPLFKDNPAIHDLHVIAYLGIPLVTSDGYVLGSFCVIDSQPRKWREEEVGVMKKLAASVMTEIQLRTQISARHQAEEKLKEQNEELRQVNQTLVKETAERVRVLEQLWQRERMLVQQSRLAAMGEMMSNIAHQWRQPLNTLGLMFQSLPLEYQSGTLTSEALEAIVSQAMQVVTQMSQTINDFKDFFKPDKERVLFDLKQALQAGLSLVQATLKERRIRVDLQCAEKLQAEGYPKEFSQVILNLVMNARDALIERRVADPVIIIRACSGPGKAVVTITDNAGGIAEAHLERIFEPYFTTKGPMQGTGLGLYMAKMIIEKNMGGSLSASNVAGGAEFRIMI